MSISDSIYSPLLQTASSMKFSVVFLVWIVMACPGQSHAREWLGLAGLELAEQSNAYAFAGAVAPLDSSAALGQGWVQRYWLDWVKYQFDSEAERVHAKAPGFSASLGYQQSDSTGSWAAYAGAGYRKTTLTPDRQNAEVRGSQSSLQLLAEMDRRLAQDWRFTGAIQFSVGPDSYWSRAKFLNKPASAAYWQGIEIVYQGDPDYKTYKLGLVFDELSVGKSISANFKVGANKTRGLRAIGYIGIEFVGIFGDK